jgi:hypothetical protein
MDLIISTENDFQLNDFKYVFTKKYPCLMVFFISENDEEIDGGKLFFEITQKREKDIYISDDSTINAIIKDFKDFYGVFIDIMGIQNNELIELPKDYSIKRLNNNLFRDGYDEFPRSTLGLRVVKANNYDDKYILQHLDGEEVIINSENLDKNATNLMLAKDSEGKVYVINAETLEVIESV